jgi:hypothetical protein
MIIGERIRSFLVRIFTNDDILTTCNNVLTLIYYGSKICNQRFEYDKKKLEMLINLIA